MAREDWRDQAERPARPREDFGQADYSQDYAYDPRSRRGYRADEAMRDREDYGQADYTTDWAYDPERGRPYRRFAGEDRTFEPRRGERSWMDKAGDFLAGRPRHPDERGYDERRYEAEREYGEERRHRRRGGPSDRVLWAVIMERLERDRRIDLRDVRVSVHDGEVVLDGSVRTREGKRRIEDLADVDGVRNIQNNLRPRDIDRRWTLL
jgi:hypothetical protein